MPTRRFNLLVSESGGCGAVDHRPPKLIKTFEFSEVPDNYQEVIEIQIISYIKANPDEFMDLWDILADLHQGGDVENVGQLPEFFQEFLEEDFDQDEGEALLGLMGRLEEVELADLQSLLINTTITQATNFCSLDLMINLQEIPSDDYVQLG